MNFKPFREYSDTFIETGTHMGESVQSAVQAGFTNIKTVELSEAFYLHAKKRFAGNRIITCYLGKSVDRLPEMIEGIPIPSVFWLDAHPAGPGTAGHEEWLKRDESVFMDNVLRKELEIILRHGRHVILIDDQHGWATAQKFADQIDEYYPDCYRFSVIDEIRDLVHYREKILVCEPV